MSVSCVSVAPTWPWGDGGGAESEFLAAFFAFSDEGKVRDWQDPWACLSGFGYK